MVALIPSERALKTWCPGIQWFITSVAHPEFRIWGGFMPWCLASQLQLEHWGPAGIHLLSGSLSPVWVLHGAILLIPGSEQPYIWIHKTEMEGCRSLAASCSGGVGICKVERSCEQSCLYVCSFPVHKWKIIWNISSAFKTTWNKTEINQKRYVIWMQGVDSADQVVSLRTLFKSNLLKCSKCKLHCRKMVFCCPTRNKWIHILKSS